jgi:perosamine synthetase
MKFAMASPYFPPDDVEEILVQFREILEGRDLLAMGKHVQAFEKKFGNMVGAKYALATPSCTSALEMCLKAFGIGPQDEVVIPVQTFIATGSCVVRNGAKVVFCETDENFLIDFEDLKRRISSRTKAVIIVHFAGLIHPQIKEIYQYLKERHIYLIEDAAHAVGAKAGGLFAGNLSDAACFSFFSTKIMTTGEGGMITTKDEKLYLMCSSFRNRGADVWNDPNVFSELGANHRVTEIQGILGLFQLKRLEEFIGRRNRVAEIYKDVLVRLEKRGDLRFQKIPAGFRHSFWRFSVFVQKENVDLSELQKRMAISGIPIDFPYTPLLHLQPVFRKLNNHSAGSFQKTEVLASRHFCLPMHALLTDKGAEIIAGSLQKELE